MWCIHGYVCLSDIVVVISSESVNHVKDIPSSCEQTRCCTQGIHINPWFKYTHIALVPHYHHTQVSEIKIKKYIDHSRLFVQKDFNSFGLSDSKIYNICIYSKYTLWVSLPRPSSVQIIACHHLVSIVILSEPQWNSKKKTLIVGQS